MDILLIYIQLELHYLHYYLENYHSFQGIILCLKSFEKKIKNNFGLLFKSRNSLQFLMMQNNYFK